jgi:hypothetical protein
VIGCGFLDPCCLITMVADGLLKFHRKIAHVPNGDSVSCLLYHYCQIWKRLNQPILIPSNVAA